MRKWKTKSVQKGTRQQTLWFEIVPNSNWDFWRLLNFLSLLLQRIHTICLCATKGYSSPQSWAHLLQRQCFGLGEQPYQRLVNPQTVINHVVWVWKYPPICVIVRNGETHKSIYAAIGKFQGFYLTSCCWRLDVAVFKPVNCGGNLVFYGDISGCNYLRCIMWFGYLDGLGKQKFNSFKRRISQMKSTRLFQNHHTAISHPPCTSCMAIRKSRFIIAGRFADALPFTLLNLP